MVQQCSPQKSVYQTMSLILVLNTIIYRAKSTDWWSSHKWCQFWVILAHFFAHLKLNQRKGWFQNLLIREAIMRLIRICVCYGSFILQTSQELKMLSPSHFIQGSQCQCLYCCSQLSGMLSVSQVSSLRSQVSRNAIWGCSLNGFIIVIVSLYGCVFFSDPGVPGVRSMGPGL